MQGAQHEMARLRRFEAQLHRLAVAHLADQNDLRRLPQCRAQTIRECVKVRPQFALIEGRPDIGMDELDRVFQRHDMNGLVLVDLP